MLARQKFTYVLRTITLASCVIMPLAAIAQETEAAPETAPAAHADHATSTSNEPNQPAANWTAGYDKGFFIKSPDDLFKLKLGGRVQARLTMEVGDGDDPALDFSIPRARMKISGHVATKDLGYMLQIDFGKGFVTLKDGFLDYAISPGWAHVRAGQFKRPFSRQQINSSAKLSLVDRAITDRAFGAGRDIGVIIHNGYGKKQDIEYAVGFFNGTGDTPTFDGTATMGLTTGDGDSSWKFSNIPDQFNPMLVLRVGYNYGGIEGYEETDFKGGPFGFAVAAGAQVDLDADGDQDANIRAGLDFIMKVEGFSASGALYAATAQTGGEGLMGEQEFASLGFHFQGSYLIADMYEVVARFAMIDPDGDNNTIMEMMVGTTIYALGKYLKWQLDAGATVSEGIGGDSTDILARTQLQVAF